MPAGSLAGGWVMSPVSQHTPPPSPGRAHAPHVRAPGSQLTWQPVHSTVRARPPHRRPLLAARQQQPLQVDARPDQLPLKACQGRAPRPRPSRPLQPGWGGVASRCRRRHRCRGGGLGGQGGQPGRRQAQQHWARIARGGGGRELGVGGRLRRWRGRVGAGRQRRGLGLGQGCVDGQLQGASHLTAPRLQDQPRRQGLHVCAVCFGGRRGLIKARHAIRLGWVAGGRRGE